jgi:Protein tyrosine/serine phosphatase
MSEIKESFAEWKQRIFFDHGFLRALYPNIWKIDKKFYRSAQPSPSLFLKFKNKGIKTIINLRGSRDDLVDQMERRVCQNLNLNLIEFKLHSRGAPSIQQIKESRELFKQIKYPVLIHCKSGADRTGLMATLYLIFKGIDIKTAKSQLSFRYLHVRLAKSGILDSFFDNYVNYLSNNGKLSFWEWSEKIYSPDELKKNFKLNFFKIVIDKILQRE